MRDLTVSARALLDALRGLGRAPEAQMFEAKFEALNWQISEEDFLSLNRAIALPPAGVEIPTQAELEIDGVAAPERQIEQRDDPGRIATAQDPALAGVPPSLTMFEPFIATIRDWEAIVTKLSDLAAVGDFENCRETVSELFVDVLGFDASALDVTSRLDPKQRTFERLASVADYEGFTVSIVHMRRENPYATSYKPVFRIYPYGLCVVVNTASNVVRFVYSSGKAAERTVEYRTLTGNPRGRDSSDNLLVWARRLDLMRPEYGDDSSKLRDRVDAVLSCTPADLASRWTSRLVATDVPLPGPGWQELIQEETRSFLQREATCRLHWGLEAVLRDRFPMFVARGKGTLSYCRYRIEGESMTSGSSGVGIVLELQYSNEGGKAEFLELPCTLYVPNDDGCFVLGGQSLSFEPRLDAKGRLATRILSSDGGDLLGDYSEEFLGVTDEPEPAEESETDESDPSEIEMDTIQIEGASLRTFLEVAVSRKLSALSARIYRLPDEQCLTASSLLATSYAFFDAEGRFELCSVAFLATALVPVSEAHDEYYFRAVVQDDRSTVALPRAWACLDASSYAADGRWFPVAGTRLHPCGELAVPAESADGFSLAIVDESALEANPRVASNDTTGLASWWISPSLAAWAQLPVGGLSTSSVHCRKGFVTKRHQFLRIPIADECSRITSHQACPRCIEKIKIEVDCGCGRLASDPPSEPVLAVAPHVLDELRRNNPIHKTLILDLPAIGEAAAIRAVVSRGTAVRPGQPWLHIPEDVWCSSTEPQYSWLVKAIVKITGQQCEELGYLARVPAGWQGKVVSIYIDPTLGRYGDIVGWRATLKVSCLPVFGDALLPDGRLAKVRRLSAEDQPLLQGHKPIDAMLYDDLSAGNLLETEAVKCFYGATEGGFHGQLISGHIGWIPVARSCEPDLDMKYSLLDNAAIPGETSPMLTSQERLWLRLAHPKVAKVLDDAELRGPGRHVSWEPALGAVLLDLQLGAAAQFVSPEAIVAGPVRDEGSKERITDPLRSQVAKWRVDQRGNLGGFLWQCTVRPIPTPTGGGSGFVLSCRNDIL